MMSALTSRPSDLSGLRFGVEFFQRMQGIHDEVARSAFKQGPKFRIEHDPTVPLRFGSSYSRQSRGCLCDP
jgi:hypothetical protein